MDAKQVIKLLEENGWIEVRQKGSHRIFKHSTHGSKDIPISNRHIESYTEKSRH